MLLSKLAQQRLHVLFSWSEAFYGIGGHGNWLFVLDFFLAHGEHGLHRIRISGHVKTFSLTGQDDRFRRVRDIRFVHHHLPGLNLWDGSPMPNWFLSKVSKDQSIKNMYLPIRRKPSSLNSRSTDQL